MQKRLSIIVQKGARRGRAPFAFLAIALAALVCGCDSSQSPQPGGFVQPAVWRWDNPLPTAHELRAVHGSSSDNVVAVGEFGTVLSFDGNTWRLLESATSVTLNGVWGGPSGVLWVAGNGGVVMRRNASGWRSFSTPAGSLDLFAVWGVGDSFLVVAGASGFVMRWDGQSWMESTLSFPDLFDNYAVWANAPDTIYVVGEHAANQAGSSYRFDGTTWNANPTGISQDLFSLFGTSGEDVVAVGANRTLLHFDGNAWAEVPAGNGLEELRGVWGTDTANLWLVGRQAGAGDALFRYSGGAVTPYGIGLGEDLFGVWGAPASSITAVGANGTVLSDDGGGWMETSSGPTDDLCAVSGAGGTVIAVGGAQSALTRGASGWEANDTGHAPGFVDVWALDTASGFAVSTTGTVLMYDASGWTEQISTTTRAVWAASASEAWSVGSGVRKLNGAIWIPFSPAPPATGLLNDVWGNTGGDIYAVGEAGAVLHWDGSAWAKLDSLTSQELFAVWGTDTGEIFAVGAGGTALRYDAAGNGAAFSISGQHLRGVWASSSSFAVAVGDTGTLVVFDGTDWSAAQPLTQLDLRSVWGASPSDVFAVGERGVVLRLSR